MGKKTILVVDDEPNIRSMLSRMLSQDYTVIGASNGEEVINIARRRRPDLILMDVMMPKMNGYTACLAIKRDQKTRTIPVVLLTGIDYELNIKLGKEMGADDYLIKSLSAADIKKTIDRIFYRKR